MIHKVVVCAAVMLACTQPVHAQQYPAKPVRLVMPYPAGGSTDIVGRLVAERLTPRLGQPVLVDNRPGASAQIGTEAAARAPADGYTLLMATSTNTINHALNPKLPYDFSRVSSRWRLSPRPLSCSWCIRLSPRATFANSSRLRKRGPDS